MACRLRGFCRASLGAGVVLAVSLGSALHGQGVVFPPIGQIQRQQPGLPPPRVAEETKEKGKGGEASPVLPAPQRIPQTPGYDLNTLIKLMHDRNPRLAQAALAIEVAAGQALQAGLYPNPVVSVAGDEIADRTGPVILNAPQISQEIVTAGKLDLSRAAAERGMDQAALELIATRFERMGAVRSAYYEVLTLQRRLEILEDLYRLADESLKVSEKLIKAGQAARLDQVQLEVERERFRADQEATRRELQPAFQRLAAAVGVSNLPYHPLAGTLDQSLPEYDMIQARDFIVRAHPDILWAKKGIERARLLLDRARVEPIPNVTLQGGYVYQGQNRSNDFNLGLMLPVPIWNRNQGNIAASQAELGQAIQQVTRVENDLSERLGRAFEMYASAKRRAELYRIAILPRARESYDLSIKAYRSGQFDYLRVLEAQRIYSQADLEYIRSLGDAWRSAADISSLLLEEKWPLTPTPPNTAPQLPGPQPAAPAGKN